MGENAWCSWVFHLFIILKTASEELKQWYRTTCNDFIVIAAYRITNVIPQEVQRHELLLLTCSVPLVRYITMARSVRNHFFMNIAVPWSSLVVVACCSVTTVDDEFDVEMMDEEPFVWTLPPAIRWVSMYSAKYINNVTFFWCSLDADSELNV